MEKDVFSWLTPVRSTCAQGVARWRAAFFSGVVALICAAALLCMPGIAFAGSDDEGDIAIAPVSSSSTNAEEARASTASDGLVSVDADGGSAVLEDCSFALDSFSRSQVGSNTDVAGVYAGYRYYVSDEPGSLVAVATANAVVVHVSADAAARSGFNIADQADQDMLKRLLIALDGVNTKGGTPLTDQMEWHFTEKDSFVLDGVAFKFDQQLKQGEYYACVIGQDGSDVTSASATTTVKPTFADMASLVPSTDVQIATAPSGIAAMVAFVQGIDMSPLWVTLKTTGTAIVFIFVLGLLAAYFSLRIPPRAQDIADSIFTIPMVLPPTVCGFLLLLALGKNTAVGQWFIDIGFPLIFSWQATVIAAVVVAFPLMYRSARGAFENLDSNMLDAARTLGWSNAKIFFKLMLPLSWSSIAAGTVLSFARALGEFGATLFLAGNYLGITRTIPIAIYFEWMNGNTDVAIFWTVIIMIFSFVVILFINLWSRRTTKYRRGIES